MDVDDPFLLQLTRAIQAWLWVESELYWLYAMLMRGANSHLVSATFNSIQSVDAKLTLLTSCFTLVFERDGRELKEWKTLRSKLDRLNKKRNKLVHEPVSIYYHDQNVTVSIGPSHSNALALAKGQTTHRGKPVVSAEYTPSSAKLLQDHRLELSDVRALENTFMATAREMQVFRESVSPKVTAAIQAAARPRRTAA
jgi:Ulp1 family protease